MTLRLGRIVGKARVGRRLNTITNTTLASSTYNGNGSTTAFATGFQFIANADLQVIVTSSAGVETIKTLTTHYTVTGAGSPSGGTVTFLTAPASGEKVNIRSNVTLDQQTDYQEGSSFSAATHETALDKLTKITQQVKEITDRSIKLPISNQSITSQTPVVTADYILGVNSGATALEWKSPATVALGTSVSTYAATLLDDADASAARTTLGLGSLATQSGTFSGTSSGTNTGDQLTFKTIAIAGQSDVVADSATDTLTLVAGANVTLTTNASTDTITIDASGGGTLGVSGGGTGVTSLTTYAPIFGGTTGTGAVQSGTVGTSGQVLTSNGAGALPTFQTASPGAIIKISTATASASATVDFTGLSSTYREYILEFDSLVPATDDTAIWVRTSTNNGSSYDSAATDYAYTYNGSFTSTSSVAGSSGDTKIVLNGSGAAVGIDVTDTVGRATGYIRISKPSAAQYALIRGQVAYISAATPNAATVYQFAGFRKTAADVDAIRILMSSGNITSGNFTLYGVL